MTLLYPLLPTSPNLQSLILRSWETFARNGWEVGYLVLGFCIPSRLLSLSWVYKWHNPASFLLLTRFKEQNQRFALIILYFRQWKHVLDLNRDIRGPETKLSAPGTQHFSAKGSVTVDSVTYRGMCMLTGWKRGRRVTEYRRPCHSTTVIWQISHIKMWSLYSNWRRVKSRGN